MTSSPSPQPARAASPSPLPLEATAASRRATRGLGRAVAALTLGCVGAGLVAGVAWRAVVRIPSYRLNASSHALISERGLAAIFSIDAWYAAVGVICGLVIGLAAWVFFRRLGWPCVLLGVGGSLLAALVCAITGWSLGPGPLQGRLAAAAPGDLIPVDFQVHAYPTVAFWPFAAMLPLLLLAALAPDPEDPTPRSRRGSAADVSDDSSE